MKMCSGSWEGVWKKNKKWENIKTRIYSGSWEGAWHHLMHTAPLNISLTSIDTKVFKFVLISFCNLMNRCNFASHEIEHLF